MSEERTEQTKEEQRLLYARIRQLLRNITDDLVRINEMLPRSDEDAEKN